MHFPSSLFYFVLFQVPLHCIRIVQAAALNLLYIPNTWHTQMHFTSFYVQLNFMFIILCNSILRLHVGDTMYYENHTQSIHNAAR